MSNGISRQAAYHDSPVTSAVSLARMLAVAGIAFFAIPVWGQDALYVKKDSLQQTMLETRSRLLQWQSTQTQALQAAKLGPWYSTTLQPSEKPEAVTGALANIEQAIKRNDGKSRWTRCRVDSASNPVLARSNADYLYTTITVKQPTRITIELSRHERFGGFAYRPPPCNAGIQLSDPLVWLNERQLPLVNKLEGYRRVPVAKRQGWHDEVLIDLDLSPGTNHLLLSLRKDARKSWFTDVSLTPNPIPVVWALLETDFPRSDYRLLSAIHYSWFSPTDGWFTSGNARRLELQLLTRLTRELGPDRAAVDRQLATLSEATPVGSDRQWLDLCVTAAELRDSLRGTDALRAAISEIYRAFPADYPGETLQSRADDLRRRLLVKGNERLDPAERESQTLFQELAQLKHEALVARNPLLAGKLLLFVKRHTYDSDHYYDEFVAGIRRFGGNLCILSMDDRQVTEISPELSEGVVDRYDLSFDARHIIFGYKPPKPEGFRIYEIDIDGSHLRQVTVPPGDEAQRIATYATCSPEQLEKSPGRYGHWTDDMHPCYLPDGRIVFTSTRSERSVLCGGHGLTVTNLYRINSDGSGLHQLSQGALSEFCPSMMNDGRILYNRWEYVDKGAGAVQSLWAMCPDGSRSEEIYGNNITTPGVFNQAHNVPGHNDLISCLGAGHCPGNVGAILLIDLQKDKRSEEAMTALTPNCIPKGNWGMRQKRNGRWITDICGPWYCDPFPLSDPTCREIAGKFFLVSCNPAGEWNDPAGYGIYLLDVFGNRVPIHHDPAISCWQARPLEPRHTPPILSDAPTPDSIADSRPATVLVSDVYQGLDSVARGDVKYLRVMEQIPRPWSAYLGYKSNDRAPGQMVAISLYTHLSVKVLHGVVPVYEDGSAFFTVPADRSIFLQALDKNFMEIQRMRTFVNFQPGEQRSCIGCHEPRHQAPVNRSLMALQKPPTRPQPQPGETAPRPLHYPSDVQPIFDRHCVSCHGGEKTEGELDLSGEMTELFCRSYENIIAKDLVNYIQEFVGPKPEGANAMGYAPSVPPYTYGSHQSRLIQILRRGHYEVVLSNEEFVTLVTWVDANAPYYGSYFGRRNIAHRNERDFRPVPTLESALGISKRSR